MAPTGFSTSSWAPFRRYRLMGKSLRCATFPRSMNFVGERTTGRRTTGATILSKPEIISGFRDWLADRASGKTGKADYFVEREGWVDGKSQDKFNIYPFNIIRWFEFDRGEDVVWYAHEDGQPGLEGGGFAEFQAALQAWNDDPGSNIMLTYGGTTTAAGGY